jgi:hypothetical protein
MVDRRLLFLTLHQCHLVVLKKHTLGTALIMDTIICKFRDLGQNHNTNTCEISNFRVIRNNECQAKVRVSTVFCPGEKDRGGRTVFSGFGGSMRLLLNRA